MSTENPKISAYVPQVVFDRFKKYQEERGISMSQAVLEIFTHYFGLNLEESTEEFTSGLPGRLIQVEESLIELKQLYINLAAKVENIKTISEPLIENGVVNDVVEVNKQPEVELEISPSSELLSELSSSASKLAQRLSLSRESLRNRRKRMSVEELGFWTKQNDPDSIAWIYSEELKCYIPFGNLSNQQVESLRVWKKQQFT